MKSRLFFAIFVLGCINGYAASRVIYRWPWAQDHLLLAWGVVFALFLLQLAGPFGGSRLFTAMKNSTFSHRIWAARLSSALEWLSYAAFGVISFMVVYGLLADLAGFLWEWVDKDVTPAQVDRTLLCLLGLFAFGTAGLGFWQAQRGPIVKRVEITLDHLPAAFDGFRIAQISDLHVGGLIGRTYAQKVVDITANLKPDLIAMTGDFIDGTVENLADDVAPLAQLSAPYGKFFITGNHEYYWNGAAWIAHFRKLGARVLVNEHEVVKRGDSAIVIAGVTDYSTSAMASNHASDPVRAIADAPAGLVKILLAHQPITYKRAEPAGYNLQLSGHTHAGQYFPFTILIRLFQRYHRGLFKHGKMWIYVNPGTGFWGPPLRAGAAAEITEIVLRRAN